MSMNISPNQQNVSVSQSPNFKGAIKISTFNKVGKATINEFKTNPEQDKLIKATLDYIYPDSHFGSRGINEKETKVLNSLIELITGKRPKNAKQNKILIRDWGKNYTYGDASPQKGGIYCDFKF